MPSTAPTSIRVVAEQPRADTLEWAYKLVYGDDASVLVRSHAIYPGRDDALAAGHREIENGSESLASSRERVARSAFRQWVGHSRD